MFLLAVNQNQTGATPLYHPPILFQNWMDMDLVALEEIRQVKYRYLRCVDLKLWDEMADVFTAEASAEYGTHAVRGSLSLRGRDAIMAYLRENLGPEHHHRAPLWPARNRRLTATTPRGPGRSRTP